MTNTMILKCCVTDGCKHAIGGEYMKIRKVGSREVESTKWCASCREALRSFQEIVEPGNTEHEERTSEQMTPEETSTQDMTPKQAASAQAAPEQAAPAKTVLEKAVSKKTLKRSKRELPTEDDTANDLDDKMLKRPRLDTPGHKDAGITDEISSSKVDAAPNIQKDPRYVPVPNKLPSALDSDNVSSDSLQKSVEPKDGKTSSQQHFRGQRSHVWCLNCQWCEHATSACNGVSRTKESLVVSLDWGDYVGGRSPTIFQPPQYREALMDQLEFLYTSLRGVEKFQELRDDLQRSCLESDDVWTSLGSTVVESEAAREAYTDQICAANNAIKSFLLGVCQAVHKVFKDVFMTPPRLKRVYREPLPEYHRRLANDFAWVQRLGTQEPIDKGMLSKFKAAMEARWTKYVKSMDELEDEYVSRFFNGMKMARGGERESCGFRQATVESKHRQPPILVSLYGYRSSACQ